MSLVIHVPDVNRLRIAVNFPRFFAELNTGDINGPPNLASIAMLLLHRQIMNCKQRGSVKTRTGNSHGRVERGMSGAALGARMGFEEPLARPLGVGTPSGWGANPGALATRGFFRCHGQRGNETVLFLTASFCHFD